MKFQIGKNGITDGVIDSLNLGLKNHRQVRISVLKSFVRDREKIRETAEEIKSRLDSSCDYKIIGFTIILIKKGKSQSRPGSVISRR